MTAIRSTCVTATATHCYRCLSLILTAVATYYGDRHLTATLFTCATTDSHWYRSCVYCVFTTSLLRTPTDRQSVCLGEERHLPTPFLKSWIVPAPLDSDWGQSGYIRPLLMHSRLNGIAYPCGKRSRNFIATREVPHLENVGKSPTFGECRQSAVVLIQVINSDLGHQCSHLGCHWLATSVTSTSIHGCKTVCNSGECSQF